MMYSPSIKKRVISSIIAGFCAVCMTALATLYQAIPVSDAVMSCWCRVSPYGEDWTHKLLLNRAIKWCPIRIRTHAAALDLSKSAQEVEADDHSFQIAAGAFCRPIQIGVSLLGIFLVSSSAWFFVAGFVSGSQKGAQ